MVYQSHAKRKGASMTLDDVKLAITSRCQHQYSEIPSVDNLVALARRKNDIALKVDKRDVFLPPARHCVSARNYRVTLNNKRQRISVKKEE